MSVSSFDISKGMLEKSISCPYKWMENFKFISCPPFCYFMFYKKFALTNFHIFYDLLITIV